MMKRADIRELKRAVLDHNTDAMQALLQRSVRCGHKRLALLRCVQAEQMGISVKPETLQYCRELADRMPRAELEKILRQAVLRQAAAGARTADI
ncbi:MAG: hypothetical protein ACREX0_07515 [Noviherbaspirillum sp.]